MMKTLRIRLLFNEKQEELAWSHVHGCRFIWNYFLGLSEERYKNGDDHLRNYGNARLLTKLKELEEFSWLNILSRHSLCLVLADLDDAYRSFFKHKKGHPNFKSKKKAKPSFPVRTERLRFNNGYASIEKIGRVKYCSDYDLTNYSKLYNARITYIDDKWILTVVVEFENQKPTLTDKAMGIDLGVKNLAVISFGGKPFTFGNINKSSRMKVRESRLKAIQRRISRKYRTNGNYNKTGNIKKLEAKVKKLYKKQSNKRRDYIHKTTHSLISLLPFKVVMENLDVSSMMKNKHMAKLIQEQCFYEFIRQMKYKCEWAGIEFVQVSRYYPSSRKCSCCGHIKRDLKLSERVYKCETCGLVIDRDFNAALNLEKYVEHVNA